MRKQIVIISALLTAACSSVEVRHIGELTDDQRAAYTADPKALIVYKTSSWFTPPVTTVIAKDAPANHMPGKSSSEVVAETASKIGQGFLLWGGLSSIHSGGTTNNLIGGNGTAAGGNSTSSAISGSTSGTNVRIAE